MSNETFAHIRAAVWCYVSRIRCARGDCPGQRWRRSRTKGRREWSDGQRTRAERIGHHSGPDGSPALFYVHPENQSRNFQARPERQRKSIDRDVRSDLLELHREIGCHGHGPQPFRRPNNCSEMDESGITHHDCASRTFPCYFDRRGQTRQGGNRAEKRTASRWGTSGSRGGFRSIPCPLLRGR